MDQPILRLEDVARSVGCTHVEIEAWVTARLVLPARDAQGYAFAEVDMARIRLIRELRHDLGVEDETLPLVLSLIDQIHALRRQTRLLLEALGDLPEPARQALLERLGGDGDPSSPF